MILALLTGVGAEWASARPAPDAAVASCNPYPDVTAANSACANIAWLKGQAITKPADGLYHPLDSVTRGSMTAFLFRLVNPGQSQPECWTRPFPDVPTDSTFCGYITWAKANGIAYGYPDGSYGPGRAVTRGAMAAYLYRIANPGHGAGRCTAPPFSDVGVNDTFCGVITWMAANGVTYGVGGNKYGTRLPVTRQAMASFLHRIFNLIGGHTFSDGMFMVGVDVSPGLYRAILPSGSLCYWERLSSATGSFDSIIANETVSGYALIQVLAGDRYIKSSGCGVWHLVSASAPWSLGGKIPGDGMFVVGKDVRPGLYHQTKAGCYWERAKDASGDVDAIIANDYTSGASYVRIQQTDKVFITGGCSTFTRVG
jgi:hypothetical protein